MHANKDSFEQKSFEQLHPPLVSSEILATVVCLIVLILADVIHGIPLWLYSFCLIEAIATYLTYKSVNTLQLWLTGLVLVCACAACLGALADVIGNPTFWFLPIGMVISLPVSAMHARPFHAVSIGVAIWATLFCVIYPHFERQLDLILTVMIILTSMMLTLLVCVTFCQIRKNVFDLQRKLHDLAYEDTLTGLPNRRAFMEKLEHTPATAPLFFLMLDIDNFKSINDGHGHNVGDLVLVEVAKVLRQQTQGHSIARLGGEEFSVMARVPDVEAAQQLAQRVVDAVNQRQINDLWVSVSIGLAALDVGESIFSLMRRADLALYAAKHGGKNRYAMAVPAALTHENIAGPASLMQ